MLSWTDRPDAMIETIKSNHKFSNGIEVDFEIRIYPPGNTKLILIAGSERKRGNFQNLTNAKRYANKMVSIVEAETQGAK